MGSARRLFVHVCPPIQQELRRFLSGALYFVTFTTKYRKGLLTSVNQWGTPAGTTTTSPFCSDRLVPPVTVPPRTSPPPVVLAASVFPPVTSVAVPSVM